MGAEDAKLIAYTSGFAENSVRQECTVFASACLCVLLVLVLGSASLCQKSSGLPVTCSNTGAIRHSLSDEMKQFPLKRHFVKTGVLELM